MIHNSIFAGSAFRLALNMVILYTLLLLLAGTVLVQMVSNTLEDELKDRVQEEVILFREIYAAEGRQGIISVITDLSRVASNENVRGLFDSSKQHLAGHISLAPEFLGLYETTLSLGKTASQNDIHTYHAKSVKLNKLTLVVGRNTRMVTAMRRELIFWLGISGIGLSGSALLLGYFASRRSLHKLQAIDQTLRAVSKGDMHARIDTGPSNEQIDRVARQTNQHLDHLSKLVASTRSTAAAIAHDLKTPLSHARIALYKASDVHETKAINDTIADALEELEQLNQTVDTILRISRIKNLTDRSKFSLISIHALIAKVIDMLAPVAEEASIQLEQYSANQNREIVIPGDLGMMQQMLINLTSNAISHCPAGSKVCLSAESKTDQITLIVKDNGPGIPEDKRELVLEPFKRLDSARSSDGNGLGLALVNAIVTHHQATIQLEDARPGLRVRINFPMP